MARHIFRCAECGSYTMKDIHCDKKTLNIKPPKYSPEDNYGKYRRLAKEQIKKEEESQ